MFVAIVDHRDLTAAAMEEALQGLARTVSYLNVANAHYPRTWLNGTPGTLMVPGIVARQLHGPATLQSTLAE